MSEETIPVVVVMGVCGAGKSRIAADLAGELGGAFIEADRFHPEANKQRMQRGEALSDADRLPWLRDVAAAAVEAGAGHMPVVVACSALKRSYRDLLRADLGDVLFAHLDGERSLISGRLAARQGHFVGEALLDSQLATLEPLQGDETGVVLDISNPVRALVLDLVTLLTARGPAAKRSAGGQGT